VDRVPDSNDRDDRWRDHDRSWEALRAKVLGDLDRLERDVADLATRDSVADLKAAVSRLAEEVHKQSIGLNTVTVKSGATGAITSIAVILIAILLEYLRRAFAGH
jgi:hypothetical protein